MSHGEEVQAFFFSEIILNSSVFKFRNVCIVCLAFNCLESRKTLRENKCSTDAFLFLCIFFVNIFSSDCYEILTLEMVVVNLLVEYLLFLTGFKLKC